MVDFFTGSLEKWENRECLKSNLKGKEDVEKQGKVDEKANDYLPKPSWCALSLLYCVKS